MKALGWIIGGFALLGLSRMVEAMGDTGANAGERLPVYLLALAILLGALFCFFKALRTLFGSGRGPSTPRLPAEPPRAAQRIEDSDDMDEDGEFDPDKALARYMERRTGQQGGATAAPSPAAAPAPRAAAPAPRTGFGRKGV
jgi:hypothetical protein